MSVPIVVKHFASLFCFSALVFIGANVGASACAFDLKGHPDVRADYDAAGVYVYQAFTAFTARNAVADQAFLPGAGFKLSRMTWLKLSFGWMLHRSDFARSPRQERVLRIKISRTFFEALLREAVPSSADHAPSLDRGAWRLAFAATDVVYQWDPDRTIEARRYGKSVLQLGIRGERIKQYAREQILSVEDLTPLVIQLRQGPRDEVPTERAYVWLDDAGST